MSDLGIVGCVHINGIVFQGLCRVTSLGVKGNTSTPYVCTVQYIQTCTMRVQHKCAFLLPCINSM